MRAAPGSSDFDLLPSPPPLLRRLLPKTIMTTFKSTPFQSLHLQNFQRPHFEKFHIFKTILLPRHVIFRSRKSIPTVLMNLINTKRLKLKAFVADQFCWITIAQQKNKGLLLGDLPGIEGVLGVLVQKRGLAHPRVAEGQEFDQVVIVHRVNNVIHKSLSLLLSLARTLII